MSRIMTINATNAKDLLREMVYYVWLNLSLVILTIFFVLQSNIEKSSLFFLIALSNTLWAHIKPFLIAQAPSPNNISDSSFSFSSYSKKVTKYCKSCFEAFPAGLVCLKVEE